MDPGFSAFKNSYLVSVPAQLAGAAALKDRAHVEASFAHNEKWRAWLTENIRKLGLRVDESVTNFVLIHFKDIKTAASADAFLSARGVILRATTAYNLPACLRMTVGPEDANRAAVAAIAQFTSQA